MAQTAQKITLSTSRDIPFDKLVLSQSNVRRIKAGVSVEELAEDIARRGLLQGLSVRPVLDADGVETGKYEIPAGGRRFQALSLLVKQKRLAKTAPVPCVLRDVTSDILAEDDSLAENMQRVALHPLDQFRAFVALREKGQGEEAIAAAFFVAPQIVKQRLKLASVAPALLDVYAEDGMTLEQLMAFTVNPDHARQVQVWDAVKNSWNKEPYSIRRMLTETSVRASDRRAVFAGVDVYEAAGGVVGEAGIRDYVPQDATLHSIADRLQAIQRRNFYQLAAAISHRGRYYHEYTMSVDVTRDSPSWQPPTADAEETVVEAIRDLARWLYRQLQTEYDHLTSDETIEDGIIVNEYTFTEGGRRFG